MNLSDIEIGTGSFLLHLMEAALKGGLVIIFVRVLARMVRRAPAAYLHVLWLSALLSLPVLLGFALVLPTWTLSIPQSWSLARSEVQTTESEPILVDLAQLPTNEPLAQPLPLEVHAPQKPLSSTGGNSVPLQGASSPPAEPNAFVWETLRDLQLLACLVWLVGVLVIVSRVLLGIICLRRRRLASQVVTTGTAWQLLQQLVREKRLSRPVLLLETQRPVIPMTWGLWHPVILLPSSHQDWTPDQLRMVLLHELAHVQRCDYLTQIITQLVRALFWFHPLLWWAIWWLRLEQERACDDAVLQNRSEPTDYAEHLLAVSSGRAPSNLVTPVALAMSRATLLNRRMKSLLDSQQRRSPMNRKLVWSFLVVLMGLLIPLAMLTSRAVPVADAGPGATPAQESAQEEPDAKSQVELVKRILQERYVKPLDEKTVDENAIRGMISGLDDPNSAYFTPTAVEQFNSQIRGELVGIGAQIKLQNDYLAIVTPLENSPALKAGIRAGDVILAIDGKNTKDVPLVDCVNLLRGKKGSVVRLNLLRTDGSKEAVKVTRDQITLSTVKGIVRGADQSWIHLLDPEHKVGYLRIDSFGPRTPDEVKTTLESLKTQGVKGLIVDLRGCPGGLMQSAIDVCDMFLTDGTIVSVKGVDNKTKTYEAMRKTILSEVPMVMLIDDATASAGEIVSGALQDRGRAVLLGARTYGKGSVQSIISLKSGGALKLTTAYHYLPSGRNIQKKPGAAKWGIDPNDGFYVPLTAKQREAQVLQSRSRGVLQSKGADPKLQDISPQRLTDEFADPQLASALTTMRAKIATGDFTKVGQSLKDLQANVKRLQELQIRREALQAELKSVVQELESIKE